MSKQTTSPTLTREALEKRRGALVQEQERLLREAQSQLDRIAGAIAMLDELLTEHEPAGDQDAAGEAPAPAGE